MNRKPCRQKAVVRARIDVHPDERSGGRSEQDGCASGLGAEKQPKRRGQVPRPRGRAGETRTIVNRGRSAQRAAHGVAGASSCDPGATSSIARSSMSGAAATGRGSRSDCLVGAVVTRRVPRLAAQPRKGASRLDVLKPVHAQRATRLRSRVSQKRKPMSKLRVWMGRYVSCTK